MQDAPAPVVDLAAARGGGRDRLIVTAMALFAERGYDGVTIRDIAADAKVSIGLIKHHFGSKDGLRDAVDAYFLARFEQFYTAAESGTHNPTLETIAATVEQWISDFDREWPAFSRYFRRALLEESEWGAALFRRYFEIVRAALDRADARGVVRADVDRLWLPFLVIFLQTGTLMLEPYITRMLGTSPFDRSLWERRHRAYDDLITHGIAPRRPRRDADAPKETP
jgi:AcrR family transcriptional regulator